MKGNTTHQRLWRYLATLCLALLVAAPAAAQQDNSSSSESNSLAGVYFIKSSTEYKYLTRGGAWGTELTYGDVGTSFIVADTTVTVDGASTAAYVLRTADLFTASGGTIGYVSGPTSAYTDTDGSSKVWWQFEETSSGSGVYYIKNSNGKYLMPTAYTANNYTYYYISETETQSAAPTFVLLNRAGYKTSLSDRLDEQATTVAEKAELNGSAETEEGESQTSDDASETTTTISSVSALETVLADSCAIDFTSSIDNPTYDAVGNWTLITTQSNGSTYTSALSVQYNTMEFYDATGGAEQTITGLEEGTYKVTVNAMCRPLQYGGNYYTTYPALDTLESAPSYAYANTSDGDNLTQVAFAVDGTNTALSSRSDFYSAATGTNNDYLVTFYVHVPSDGSLTLGFVQPARAGSYGSWTIATNWTLTRYLSTEKYYTDSLSVLITQAESISGLTDGSTEATALASALTAAKALSASSTASELQEAYSTLYAAVAAANAALAVQAVEVTAGNYYLQAYAKAGTALEYKYLGRGGAWGEEAVVQDFGNQMTVAVSSSDDKTYTLNALDRATVFSTSSGYDGYFTFTASAGSTLKGTTGEAFRFVANDAENNRYYLVNSEDYYLTTSSDETYGYDYIDETTDSTQAIIWQLISETDYDNALTTRNTAKQNAALEKAEVTDLESLTIETSYTSYISGADYSSSDAWTITGIESGYARSISNLVKFDTENGVFSFWNFQAQISQDVTGLPAGLYRVDLLGMNASFRWAGYGSDTYKAHEVAEENAYFYANTTSCPDNFKKLMGYADYDEYSNVTDSLTFLTYAGNYKNTIYVYVGEGETLTIGVVHNSLDDALRGNNATTAGALVGHQYLSDWQLTLLEPADSFKNPVGLSGDEMTEGTYYLQAISQPTEETDDDGNAVRENLQYKFLSRGGYYGWEGVVGDFGVAQVLSASDSIGTGNYYSLYSRDLQLAWDDYAHCYLAHDGSRISTGEATKGQWRFVEVSSDDESTETKSYYLVGLSVSESITTTTDEDGNTTTDTTQVYSNYYIGMASNEVNDYTYYYLTAVEDTASAVIWQLISEDDYDKLVEARLDEQATDIYTLLKEEVGDKISDSYAVTSLEDLEKLAAAGGEVDMTSAITNADYNGTDGWTYNSICPYYKKTYTGSINTSVYHIYEAQHRDIGVYTATGHAAQIVQHVTGLEAGLYKVNVAAMQTTIVTTSAKYKSSTHQLGPCEENLAVVFASAGQDTLFKQVASYYNEGIAFNDTIDDDYEFAYYSHNSGAYDNELYVYVGEDETLSIGVTMPGIARHTQYNTTIYVGPWTLTKVLVGKDIMEPDYTPGDGWFVAKNEFDPGTSAESRVANFKFALPEAFNMTDEQELQVLSTAATCSLTIKQDGESDVVVTTTASADNLSGTDKDTLTLAFTIDSSVADPEPGTTYTVSLPQNLYGYETISTSESNKRRASYRSDAATANSEATITFEVSPVAEYLDQSVILMEHRDGNLDEYRFLNQGGAWTTEAIRGEVGRPVEISVYEGAHIIRNVDLSDYFYSDKDTSFYMYYVHNDVPGFYMDSTSYFGITKSHLFQFVPTGEKSASQNKLFYLCQEDNRYYDWNNNWTVSEDDTLHFLGSTSYTNELTQYTYQYMKRLTPTLTASDDYTEGTLNAYSYDNVGNLTAPSGAIKWEILSYAAYQDTIRHMQYNSQPYRSVYAYQTLYDGDYDNDYQILDSTKYFVDYGKIESWTNNGQFTSGTSFQVLTDTLDKNFYRVDWSNRIENTDFADAVGWNPSTKFKTETSDGFTFDSIALANYNDGYFTDSDDSIVTVGGVGGYDQTVYNLPAGFYRLSVDALYLPTGLGNFLSTSHTIDSQDIDQAPTCFAFLQAKPASSSSSITSAITRVGAVATLDTVTYIDGDTVKTGLYTYPYGLESTLGQTSTSSSTKKRADAVGAADGDTDESTTTGASFRDDFLSHFNTSFYIYLPADYTLTVGFAAENAVNGGDADGSTMVTSDWTITYYPNVPCALEDPQLSMTDGEVVPSGTTLEEFTVAYPNAWTVDTCYAAIYGLYDYTEADTYADQQKDGAEKTSFSGRILDWGDTATAPSFSTDDEGNYTYDETTGFLNLAEGASVTTYTGSFSVETYSEAVDAAVDAVTDEVKDKQVTINSSSQTISDAFYHERGLKIKMSDIKASTDTDGTSSGITLTKGHMYTLEVPADIYGFVYANDSSYWCYDDWKEYDSENGNSTWATLTVGTTDEEGNTTGASTFTNGDGEVTTFYTKRYANEAILITFYVEDIEGAWYMKVWNQATTTGLSGDYAVSDVTDSLYLNRGGNYGTQAVIDTIGAPVEIQAVTGGYNIRFLNDSRTETVVESISESGDTTFVYPYRTYLYADFTQGTDLYVDGYLNNEATYGARFGISRYGKDRYGNSVYSLTDANEQSENNGNEIYRSYLDSLTLDVATTGGSEQPVVWQLVKIDDHNNYIKELPVKQVKGVAHTAYSGDAKLQYGSYLSEEAISDTTKFVAALNNSYYTPTAITLSNTNSDGAEAFGQGGGTDYSPYSLTLSDMPGGVYKFTSDAFFRATGHLVTDTLTQQVTNSDGTTIGYGDLGRGLAYISANDQSVQVKSLGEDMATSVASGSWSTSSTFDDYYASLNSGYYYANTTSYALATFNNGQYDNAVYVYIDDGDDLTLAVTKANGYSDSNWLYTANATLTWYSDRLDVTFNKTGYFGLYYQDYGLQIPRNADTGEDSLSVWTATATYSSDPTFTVDMTQLKDNSNSEKNGTDAFGKEYTIVPPHTAVYLQGEASTTYSLRKRNCGLDSIASNLVGAESAATLAAADTKYYQFSTASGSTDLSTLGFYWQPSSNQGTSITLKEHKVALALPISSSSEGASVSANIVWHYYGEDSGDDEADDATAITDVNAGQEAANANVRYGVYTLTGIRVADEVDSDLPAGIYIIDGKKTLIK